MSKILLVCDRSDAEIFSLIEEELITTFERAGDQLTITNSSSEENARRQLPGEFDLVITSLVLRTHPAGPLSTEAERGVELLLWMSRNQMNRPSILIAPSLTPKMLRAMPDLFRVSPVMTGADLIRSVALRALQMIQNAPTKCLDVEIQLTKQTEWQYRVVGDGFAYRSENSLTIDQATLDDIMVDSDTIASAKNWQVILRRIGDKLLTSMRTRGPFYFDIRDGLSRAGGEKNARVRFIVKPDLYNLALEAIPCPETADRYWMLHAPIYRRVIAERSTGGSFLFEGGQPINCLVIRANASGVTGKLFLAPLTNLERECEEVVRSIRDNARSHNIAEIVELPDPASNLSLAEQVKSALDSRDWAIVHYVGHSHYDDESKTGYVYFPKADGGLEAVDMNRFGDWLRRVTFTYFSSCDSGAGPFVFGLANRVSNILGYRWEINDAYAFEYAQEFYRTLFERRSVEKAYLAARQAMHERHPDDRIWAAPILIKQLGE